MGVGATTVCVGSQVGQVEFLVGQIPNAGREFESQQVHEGKDVIGKASSIGVMFFEAELASVLEQTVEDISGIAHIGVDDVGVKRCVLVADVGVEKAAWIAAIFGIDLA